MTIAIVEEPGGLVGDETLDELAAIALREHGLAGHALGLSLQHAIRCGDALQVAHDRVPLGSWARWVAENFGPGYDSASNYRRLALHKDVIFAEGITSQYRALELLAARKLYVKHPRLYSDALRQEARELIAAGYTQRDTARLLGVSRPTVREAIDPEKYARAKRLSKAKRYAAAKALRRERRAAAFKTAGGDIGKAYTCARLYAEQLQRVIDAETDSDARKALASAYVSLRNSEDKLNEARGTSKPREDK